MQATLGSRRADLSQLREEPVVLRVRPDPKPDQIVLLLDGERTVPEADTCGENGSGCVDLLEMQAGVTRI